MVRMPHHVRQGRSRQHAPLSRWDIFNDIIRQDEKYRQAIGAPSVFTFTAQGAAVYDGPNDPNGMTAGDEFKKLLLAGIEKNGPSAAKPTH